MSEAQLSEEIALLNEDIERELDSILDEAIRAGLDEEQQDTVMQHTHRRMDALRARWVTKLKAQHGAATVH